MFVLTETLMTPMAPTKALRPLIVSPNPSLCGTLVYARFVHFDAGAAQGLAFSRGMVLAVGN